MRALTRTDDNTRFAFQSARPARVYPPCRTASSWWSARQATEVCSVLSKTFPFVCANFAYRHPDAYHTAYCVSGLSAAQHHVHPSSARREEVRAEWKGEDGVRAVAFSEALCWVEEEGGSHIVGSAANRVVCPHLRLFDDLVLLRKLQNATHPLFNLTITHTEGIMAHFYKQSVPQRTPKSSS